MRNRNRGIATLLCIGTITGAGLAVASPAFAWDETVEIVVTCEGTTIKYTNKDGKTQIVKIKGDPSGKTYSVAPGATVDIALPSFLRAGDVVVFEQSWDGKKWQDVTEPVTVPEPLPAEKCQPIEEEPKPAPGPSTTTPVVVVPVQPAASCPLVSRQITGLKDRIKIGKSDVFQVRLRNTNPVGVQITLTTKARGAGKLVSSSKRTVRLAPNGGKTVVNMQVRAIKAGTGTVTVHISVNGRSCNSVSDQFTGFAPAAPSAPVDLTL